MMKKTITPLRPSNAELTGSSILSGLDRSQQPAGPEPRGRYPQNADGPRVYGPGRGIAGRAETGSCQVRA